MIKKAIITVLISLLGIPSIFAQIEPFNLAKYQSTTASESGSSIPPQFASDGFAANDSRWGNFTSGPHWLQISLATPMTIGSSHLYLGTPSGYLISNFVLQYHDGSNWVDIPGATVTGNTLPVLNIEFTSPITAQDFRLYTTQGSPQVKEMALYAPTADGSPVPFGTDLDLNVAKMRQYEYSSVDGANYPKLAIDGYVDDSSAWASTNAPGPHDLEIHLAQTEVISGIHLYSGYEGVAGTQVEDFDVDYWDDTASSWVTFTGGSVTGNTDLERVVHFGAPVPTTKIRFRSLDADQAFVREFVVLPDDGGAGYPLWTDVKNEAPPTESFLDYEDSYFTLENRSTGQNFSSSTTGSFTTVDKPWFQVLLNLGTDTYRLRSKDSEACFEVSLASTTEGAAIVEGTYSSMPHQRWRLEDVDGTHVRIVNVWSGMVLGLDGTNVVQQASGSEMSKQWKINYETHFPKQGQASAFHFSHMFKSSWGYDWRNTSEDSLKSGQYMPMQWGGAGASSLAILESQSKWYGRANQTTVLGFNEPDNSDQSNISEETAAYQWPRLERMRLPLLGPGVDHYFGTWRKDYEAIAEEQGLRSEYMAMHRYSTEGCSTGSPSLLINRMKSLYDEYGKPIWLTEFSARDFVGDKTTWSRNHNYNFLAEFAWRAETLPWLKKWSVFEWGIYGGDPDTTDASGDSAPTDMNSPRFALHYNNDSTDPGWEDLAELGLFLAGWDGNTNTVDDTSYIIHNKGRFLRLMDHPASNTVSYADVLNRSAAEQFMVQTAPNGNKYIVGLSDGRRLSCDGSTVGLAAADTTGTTVEWTFNEYQYGWVYIDHPSTGKRLRITDANDIDVTTNSDTYDNVRFRFIKHYLPITLTEVQSIPYTESFEDGVGAWREFDNDSARFWEVGTGGTPTAGAGPSGASDGDSYLFSEGHDAGTYVANAVECIFDFSTMSDIELSFDYHMYGYSIDFLALDVFDGSSWVTDVWKKSGQQHSDSGDTWSSAVIDLTSYAGNSAVTLRFRTANTDSKIADPAIDNIRIDDSSYNYAPVAIVQRSTVMSGAAVDITLAGRDNDGDSLSYSFNQPTHGTLTGTAPNLTYTPMDGYIGADSFTFTVNDGLFDSAPATVSITIDAYVDYGTVIFDATPANTTIIHNNGAGTLSGSAGDLTYTSPLVSFNNSGFVSTETINTLYETPLTADDTVYIKLSVSGITGTLRANGILFGMSDYTVWDTSTTESMLIQPEAGNTSNHIYIHANSFQDAGDTGGAAADALIYDGFELQLAADVNGYTFTLNSIASTATLTYSGTFAGNEFIEFFGEGHFIYQAQRYNSSTDPLVSTITEASISVAREESLVNRAPVAIAQSVSVDAGDSLEITLSGSDADSDPLTYAVSAPAHGSLSGTAPNLTYTPNANYSGSDSFTFTVNDGDLDSASATVSITVVDHGTVIFDATPENTTVVYNLVQGTPASGTVTGTAGDLQINNTGVNFGNVGFASTSDIDTLMGGTGLSATDTLTFKATITGITGGIRANGVEFGMSPTAVWREAGNMVYAVKANEQFHAFQADALQDAGNFSGKTTEASLFDGFDITMVVNAAGYTITINDVIDIANGNATTIVESGTFAGTEFMDHFGSGHFYLAVQQYNSAADTVLSISEASISLKEEQAEVPVFTAGGTYVSEGNLVLGFTGSVGYEYSIESTDNLSDPNSWTVITNIAALPESPMEVALPATNSAAFYRAMSK